jgi:hypothetical protein
LFAYALVVILISKFKKKQIKIWFKKGFDNECPGKKKLCIWKENFGSGREKIEFFHLRDIQVECQ